MRRLLQTFFDLEHESNLHPICLEDEFVRAEQLSTRLGADRLCFLAARVFLSWLVVVWTGGGLVQENLEYPQDNMF